MLQRAQLLMEQRRPKEAEELIRSYLLEEPNDVDGHTQLAWALFMQDQNKAALTVANQAVGMEPTWDHAHWIKGMILVDLKQWKEARVCARQAIALDPSDPDNYALSSQIYVNLRNWKDAIHEAKLGLALDPEHSTCRHLLSHSLARIGEKGMARESLATGLSQNPMDPDAHVQLGFNCLSTGEHARALQAFEEALRLDPEHEGAREGLVEAMKAKNPIYGFMLRGFMRLSSLPPRVLLFMFIGLFVLNRVARNLRRTHPDWEWFLEPINWLYLTVIGLMWFAESFFDLLLLSSRSGRHALIGAPRLRAQLFGASLVLIASCGAIYWVQQDPEWLWSGILILFGQIPIVAAFGSGGVIGPRIMAAIALVCNFLIVFGFIFAVGDGFTMDGIGKRMMIIGGVAGAFSSWLGMIFMVRS
ncbi:MAG: tetratricopeptide repeat protein [Planctomycetes bacterium]|nr:tetratricopeptide repeat protein [Planctomycetota bacterium]